MIQIALAGALLICTQQAPQQPPFRTATHLVEVDVRVLDNSGQFVTTLSAEDFQLTEEGAERPIDVVYLVSGTAATPVSGMAGAEPMAAPRRAWIFYFDVPHLSAAGLKRTRDAVGKFIKLALREGDLGGVVSERGMIHNRLTANREELELAVASISTPGGRRNITNDLREWPRIRDEQEAMRIADNDAYALSVALRRACDDDRTLCRSAETELMEKARRVVTDIRTAAQQTLNMLGALTRNLARVPGPKTIVFLSDGFVSEGMNTQLQMVVGHAARASARFYTIDARGLGKGAVAEMVDAQSADSSVGAPARQDLLVDGTNSLAIDTGGFAIRNENNFERALDLIERDSGTYYVLGYRSAFNTTDDGKYRRIDVRVKPAGLRVRARRGYLALEPSQLLTAVRTPSTAGTTPSSGASPELSRIPLVPRSLGVPQDVVRKVAALAGKPIALESRGHAEAGWSAYQRGDVTTAAAELGAAVAGGNAPVWVHYALGFAELAQGRPERAVRAWEQVRAAAPEFEEAYFDLADAYLQLQDASSALAILRQAEKRWPSDVEVYNALGVVQISRGALDDAVETFEKAVKAAPGDSLGYFNLGRAYSMRFFKSQRYSPARTTWVGNMRDRDLAVAQFEKYISLGGPYAKQAHEALAALAWK